MTERVFKYHGLGNDFVVMDRRARGEDIDAQTARTLCDRRRGIGADGVLVLLPDTAASARMVVHNADGSIAEMCGNGLRCAVKYLVDSSDAKPERLEVATGAGILTCDVRYENAPPGHPRKAAEVEVAMGPARMLFVDAPLEGHPSLRGTGVSMGNPHLVLLETAPDEAPRLGPLLELHPRFPQRTNVEFVRFHGEGRPLEVVVWERGCGITQACGTGACATVAAAVQAGRVPADTWVEVQLPGGVLAVKVRPDLSEVRMRGPATYVFDATVASL